MNKTIIKSKETKKRLSFIIYFLLLVLVLSGCGDPHRYRTTRYYTPDWSPDGTHIACIEEIYEFDRIDNYGMFDPRGPYNESTTRKLLIYDIDKGESKAYNYGGYYPFDLDWYPGTDILLSDGSENLRILKMSGVEYSLTESLVINNSVSIKSVRWSYDQSMIALGTRADTPVWIIDINGNVIEKLSGFGGIARVVFNSKNYLAYEEYKDGAKIVVYDLNTKEKKYLPDISGLLADWLNDDEIISINGMVLNIHNISGAFFQVNKDKEGDKLVGDDLLDIYIYIIPTNKEVQITKGISEERID